MTAPPFTSNGISLSQIQYLARLAYDAQIEPQTAAMRRFGKPLSGLTKAEASMLVDSFVFVAAVNRRKGRGPS
jgi:hypothetical protein